MKMSEFVKRFRIKNDIIVRDMEPDDMTFVIDCVVENSKDQYDFVDEHARELIYGEYASRDFEVLIATKNGVRVGMVCYMIDELVPWDTRLSGSVWMLFVPPEYRGNDRIAIQLLHHVAKFLEDHNVMVYNILAADERLVEKYKSIFGMRVIGHDYMMST